MTMTDALLLLSLIAVVLVLVEWRLTRLEDRVSNLERKK